MTDIVEQLRKFGDWIEDPTPKAYKYPYGIIHDAADEIERLREALENSQKSIRELRTQGAPTAYWDDIEAANIAALKEKP